MQLTIAKILVFLAITSTVHGLCSPTDRRWPQYMITPLPSDFGRQSTRGDCTSNGQCLGPFFGSDKLGDEVLGSQTLDDGTFVGHAWDQTVSITFTLLTTAPDTAYVEGLNLYFYNIPSRRIGLPYNIRIISPSGDHLYQLEGNDDLTLDDNGRRSVTLIPESLSFSSASDTITIIFEFSNTEQIDWLLLTEVEICTSESVVLLPNLPPPITFTPDTVGTISPPTINSSFSLSCSVTEGRFVWTWTRLTGDPLPPARVLNAGRTSILELSQLSSNDVGTYQCLATHTFGGTFGTPPVSNSLDITLSLPGTIQAENGMIQVTASDDSAVLRCFLSGYLPSMAVPSIIWRLSNNELSNDLVNSITSEQGDMFIQNGGAQPIPSLTSTLTVNLTRDPLTTGTRIYNCISSSSQMITPLVQTIVLTTDVVINPPVVNPPVNTTTPSPNTPSSIPETVELGVIILLMIIFVITLIIVIIVIKRTKKTLIVTEHNGNSEITTNSNEAYGFKPSTFSMTQNTLYGPGTTEEGVYEEPDQVQHDYEELDSFAVTSVSV